MSTLRSTTGTTPRLHFRLFKIIANFQPWSLASVWPTLIRSAICFCPASHSRAFYHDLNCCSDSRCTCLISTSRYTSIIWANSQARSSILSVQKAVLTFGDAKYMHVHARVLVDSCKRWLPPWAFNDQQLRTVILHRGWSYVQRRPKRCHPTSPLAKSNVKWMNTSRMLYRGRGPAWKQTMGCP